MKETRWQKGGHIPDLRNSSAPCAKWHLSPKVQDPLLKFSQILVLKLFDPPEECIAWFFMGGPEAWPTFEISWRTMSLAWLIWSNEPSSSMLLFLGSASWSLMESLAPVTRQICFELTPFFPMMAPASDASILILVVAEDPKLAAAPWPWCGCSMCLLILPGIGPMERGSSYDGAAEAFPSSHSPWAKWHLSPNLQPSTVLYLLHKRDFTDGGEERSW